jgi:hypothetical protein
MTGRLGGAVDDAVAVVVEAVCQGATSAVTRGTDTAVSRAYERLTDLLLGRNAATRRDLAARQEELTIAVQSLVETLSKLNVTSTDGLVVAAREVRERATLEQHNHIETSQGIVIGDENEVPMTFHAGPGATS